MAILTNEQTQKLRFADVKEKDFQDDLMRQFGIYGWRAYHTHDSRRSQSGFPDICAVHRDSKKLIYAELKREPIPDLIKADGQTLKRRRTVKITRAQTEWLTDLSLVGLLMNGRMTVHLWIPSDDRTITDIMAGKYDNYVTEWMYRQGALERMGIVEVAR